MENLENIKKIYIENLEQNIICRLATQKKISERAAMDIYFKSTLARQIENGIYGIENLDYKYLVDDLIENEINSN